MGEAVDTLQVLFVHPEQLGREIGFSDLIGSEFPECCLNIASFYLKVVIERCDIEDELP